MVSFIPLHVYSGYSFLQSGLTLPRFVGLAKKRGLRYVCLTDKNTMSGLPALAHLCKSNGLLPVYGIDIEVNGDLITLFIKDEEGYRNAMALDALASKQKITADDVRGKTKGLIAILDCGKGEFRRLFDSNAQNDIPPYLAKLNALFESLYLGIPYYSGAHSLADFIRSFVARYPYDTVAFPHLLYEKQDDAIVLEIVQAIASDSQLEGKTATGPNYFLSDEEAKAFYRDDELFNCERICSQCRFELIVKRGGILVYPNDQGMSSEDYLRKLAYEGLEKKNPGYGEEYRQRLEYELSVIIKMGYADYFLIVQDYVNYARSVGISVGPGRGSGAGSLVSYALNIVTPDPIKYDLMFERFLNPERQSMPDIDVDFADIRRDEIVAYLQKKYGYDHVAHIITMQTLGAKASLRDIGRVYGYQPREIDLIAKTIGDSNLSLRDNYRQNKHFRELVDSDPYYLQIVSLAAKIEGLPRQAGMHAAGVVLNNRPLSSVLPISDSQYNGCLSQFEMNYLEEQGFLKMDLLGLRNLTIIDNCLALIEKSKGVHLDYASLPFEDEEAIKLIASGRTMGLFQLESGGMNRAIKEVNPTCFGDIVAILALYRPGPMANIPSYARRKHGQERIAYITPELEKILSPTYGIIVYQEQITQIVRALAGFSYGEADLFRRAISKKDALKLQSLRQDFLSGCKRNGVRDDIAEKVYALIYKFADYGFNKSHSLCYAVLSCQMAYLKAHYPLEFYCAILDSASSSDPKFPLLIAEMRRSGIGFALPLINQAEPGFSVYGNRVCYSLLAIKGIQSSLAYGIYEERRVKPFEDIFDFAHRVKQYGLNAASLVRLIDAGCFDNMGHNRASLRLSSTPAINYAELLGDGEMLLDLGIPKPSISDINDDGLLDLEAEREALGMMVSGSPLEKKADVIVSRGLSRISSLPESNGPIHVAAIIASVKSIRTKKGSRMAFILFYDEEAEAEGTMFGKVYDETYPLLKEGALVEIEVRADYRKEGSYIIEGVKPL